MSLIMFELPEDTREWPRWLEHRMVGLDLADLVVELSCAIEDRPSQNQSLDAICGELMPQLLETGLSPLSTEQIRALFQQSELLLELQSRILADGGSYWDELELPASQQAAIDASTKETLVKLGASLASTPHPSQTTLSGPEPKNRRSIVWTALALAAGILIAVGLWNNSLNPTSGWGFDQSGLLTANVSAAKYLSNLAEAAGQWSRKRPDSTAALLVRLKEFRHGCDTLIAAPHAQLAAVDRQWLVDKCKEWATKIDGHIAALETAGASLEQVQQQADETIKRLQQALRDRALQVA